MSSVRRRKSKSSKKNFNFQFSNVDKRKFFCNRRYRRNLKKKLNNPICDQTSFAASKSGSISCACSTSSSTMEVKKESHGTWFWENYSNAMEWQSRHFASFWKARCEALEAENKHVYKCLNTLTQENAQLLAQVKLHGDVPATAAQTGANNTDMVSEVSIETYWTRTSEQCAGEESSPVKEEEEEEFEFEINEDMLAFLEQSAKHKQELKKQRDAEREEEERAEKENKENLKLKFPKETMQQRRDDMAQIYGSASSMILSMETAMQLSFDRFNDRYQPKPWPNIPLKL